MILMGKNDQITKSVQEQVIKWNGQIDQCFGLSVIQLHSQSIKGVAI